MPEGGKVSPQVTERVVLFDSEQRRHQLSQLLSQLCMALTGQVHEVDLVELAAFSVQEMDVVALCNDLVPAGNALGLLHTAVAHDPVSYTHLAAFLGVPREEWEHWANADSAVVHPDWRGNGLQRKLLEAALPLVRPGIVGIGATVSPENQYSLNNALACGFVIADRREMYGGYDRYLLKKML